VSGPPVSGTRRQRLAALLRERELGFEELRVELQLSVRLLEDDLRHVERSARGANERLVVEPAQCRSCGFVFRERASHHLHTPSRCPRCRSERIEDPRFRIEPAASRS
jgi:hypothetical protein